MDLEPTRHWIEEHRDLALEALRIYLGFALFAKGLSLIGQLHSLEEMARAAPGFNASAVAHYVVVAHIGGGLLLAVGFLSRLAALVQIPALAGAVIFVHAAEGLFTPEMRLEFSVLVLFLLVLFAVVGGGRWSVDHWMSRRVRPAAVH